MRVEIHSLDELEAALNASKKLAGALVIGVDVSAEHAALLDTPNIAGAVFLGCDLPPMALAAVARHGALAFPEAQGLPYLPYRAELYTASELLAGYEEKQDYDDALDSKIYRHFDAHRHVENPPIIETLSQRIHDHAIDDALADFLRASPRRIVAIMGGHSMSRTDAAFAQVVRLAQKLAERGYTLASGGGPGAMEATHLGAHLAGHGPTAVDEALRALSVAPTYRDPGWHESALEVLGKYSAGSISVSIPTWFYGHEPPNLFATHIAKYFSNSLREDGLLAIAKHGVVYAPGSAGTVQEIFMDACQNHYGTFQEVSPMVFLGSEYWTDTLPALQLLRKLAGTRQYASMLSIADEIDQVVAFIEGHPPVSYL